MAVTYLRLFPATQQFELRNGQLNVAGQLRVFYEGTDDLAAIYDTDGSQLPQPVILDDNGRSLGLFVDSKRVYRLEVYDRYGELIYTARKMVPSGGGAGSAIGNSYDVVSTDGSISVDKFDDGGVTKFDLGLGVDMDRLNPSCLKAGAAPKTGDGKFVFDELVHEGDLLSVDEHGAVRCEPAWYHFTAIVELAYDGTATNAEQQITLYTTLSNSVVDFDLSYVHRESIELSGDIHVVESNSEFVLGVTGLPNGVTASLVDFDIHAITGHEQSTEYTAGNGIDIADHVISADLDVVQQKLTAGQNITITGNVISAENLSQEQADWDQQDSEQPSFIKHKPDLSVYATTSAMETALAGKQDVISDLSTIRSGSAAGATALQPAALDDYSTTQEMNTALAAKQDVISDLSAIRAGAQAGATALQPAALDDYSTTQEMNTALAAKQDVISDLSTIRSGAALGASAVQPADMNTALAGKQDVISDLATIRSGAALGASAVQPNDLATVATTGDYDDLVDKPDLSIYAESANLATVATTGDYADLTNRPSIPTKTSDLTNDSGFITDADVPVKDVEVNGSSVVNALGVAEIDLSGYATTSAMNTALADKQDTISDLSTIRSGAALGASAVQPGDLATVATTGSYDDLSDKPSIPAAQVNSDWNAVSGVSQILNRPNLAAVATTGDYADLSNKPSIPAAQVNADWDSSSGVSAILNKPKNLVQDADYVHTDNNFTSAEKTKLSGIEAGAQVNVKPDWNAVAGADDEILNKPSLARVATSGDYLDLVNTPAIPIVDQSYNASSTHAQSGRAVAQAIAAAPGTTYTAGDAISIDQNDVISVDYDTTTLELGKSYTSDQSLSTIDSYYPYALQTNSAVHDWIAKGAPGETLRIKIPAHMFRFGSSDVRIAIGNSPASPTGSNWCYYSGLNIALIGDGSFTFYVAEQTIEIPLPLSASGWTGTVPTANQFAITFVSINNGSINEYAANGGTGSLLVAKGASGALAVKNPVPSALPLFDTGKVLTVDAQGVPGWANAQAPISAGDGISITNNVVAAKVDGTTIDTNASGELTVIGGGSDGADWTAEQGDPGYIENKPVPKTLTAGANISISEGVSTLTISAAAGLPASTSADEGKCLVVDSNGDPEWGTGGKTYTGTDGVVVDNVNDTVGLEAPVDIVAGPGIAIDNPDGNTVRVTNIGLVSVESEAVRCGTYKGDPMYEKLYTFTGTVNAAETTINMSITEKTGVGGVNRIWINPANSFVKYGTAGYIYLPSNWRLGAGRAGSVSVINSDTGTLTCRCVDTSATQLTFSIAIRYTVSAS